ncbi:TIGR03118 family protein [Methylomonas sp. AM2-LC]|uniref:TIGR03118 family protein n=1 Tax=Methylomonas sp. AM2-LC TaxID=3153301 RepID=UPI0032674200
MTIKISSEHTLHTFIRIPLLAALSLSSFLVNADTTFSQLNLVTDSQSVNSAQINDPSLKNAWGLSYTPSGAFWISDNATGVSTLYSVNPTTQVTKKLGLTVAIPGDGSVTGQVYNNNPNAFKGDSFVFVSEDGTISGWGGGTTAETLQTASNANAYKGAAIANIANYSYLYAANFSADRIDVIPGSTATPNLSGNFIDPNLPTGYAPFNIENLGGNLFVSYAIQDANKHDDVAGLGNGIVDEFDTQGNLIARVASQSGALNSPWGMAIAPSSFGKYAGDLLVANFGDGKINAYNLLTNAFVGQLLDSKGNPLSIDGIWAISVGNDGGSGSSQTLYFTAGPNGETNGLLGAVSAVPLPATVWLFGSALLGAGCLRKRPVL